MFEPMHEVGFIDEAETYWPIAGRMSDRVRGRSRAEKESARLEAWRAFDRVARGCANLGFELRRCCDSHYQLNRGGELLAEFWPGTCRVHLVGEGLDLARFPDLCGLADFARAVILQCAKR